MAVPGGLFEGSDWLKLYQQNPDPLFLPMDLQAGSQRIPLFSGKIPLSSWLGSVVPLPSIPVTFMGSPVSDLFPAMMPDDAAGAAADVIGCAEDSAARLGSWAIIVKDLPVGHFLEHELCRAGFISICHEPVWYGRIPESLDAFFANLPKGRMRRSLKGHLRKFNKHVRIRPADNVDLDFIKTSYDRVWSRADMRLEQLTDTFFRAALLHPACRMLIFEQGTAPFAFQMIWQKENIWFDKYIGTDAAVYREYSFFFMRLLHLLEIAPAQGIHWYCAGQGAGKDKAGFGFERIDVNLWIKPLALKFLSPYVLKRFAQVHNRRVYSGSDD